MGANKLFSILSIEAIVASLLVAFLTILACRQFIKSRLENESDPLPFKDNGFERGIAVGVFGIEAIYFFFTDPAPYVEDAAVQVVCDTVMYIVSFLVLYGIFTLFGIKRENSARRAALAFVWMVWLYICLFTLYFYSMLAD